MCTITATLWTNAWWHFTYSRISTCGMIAARAIGASGATKTSSSMFCYGYGLSIRGPGLNGSSHKVGSLTVLMSSGNTERLIRSCETSRPPSCAACCPTLPIVMKALPKRSSSTSPKQVFWGPKTGVWR